MNTAVRRLGLGIGVISVVLGTGFVWVSRRAQEPTKAGALVAAPMASSAAPVQGSARWNVVDKGSATFLIDAPLEKIKGASSTFRGHLDVDWAALEKTRGQIDLDLQDLKTATFDDPKKDGTQTEHAHNWLGLGTDAAGRDENRYARFVISSVEVPQAPPSQTAGGTTAVALIAHGDLWLHGISAKKTVKLSLERSGPANTPTTFHVRTTEPLRVSLAEHDVKPRDVAGTFLAGALAQVGKKIDDTVQVSLFVRFAPAESSMARSEVR